MILITGCAGFIGSHLTERLLEKSKVVGIDNFDDYYDPKIKEENVSNFLDNPNFTLYREDIRNFDEIKKVFEENKINKVVHLAAKAGIRASIKNPLLYQDVNVRGTSNLLKLAKDFKVKNFVFSSSSSVYGNEKIPFSEDSETNPISPYGTSKKAAELECKKFHDSYGLKVTCLRFFTVYGPRGRPDMAPYKFTRLIDEGNEIQMYGDGTSKRDYTYVADIVEGIIQALEKNLDFEIINLGCSEPVELKRFISLIEKNLGKKAMINQVEMQPGDMKETYADASKARKLLNWKPKINIEEGIKLFTDWYKRK